jgi:hypothetical protein
VLPSAFHRGVLRAQFYKGDTPVPAEALHSEQVFADLLFD